MNKVNSDVEQQPKKVKEAINILDSLIKMVKSKARVFYTVKMEIDILETGSIIISMDKEFTHLILGKFIKDH